MMHVFFRQYPKLVRQTRKPSCETSVGGAFPPVPPSIRFKKTELFPRENGSARFQRALSGIHAGKFAGLSAYACRHHGKIERSRRLHPASGKDAGRGTLEACDPFPACVPSPALKMNCAAPARDVSEMLLAARGVRTDIPRSFFQDGPLHTS